jgi:hypothetical protein
MTVTIQPIGKLTWAPPVAVPHADFPSTQWTTTCGRYRVIRAVAAYTGEAWAGSDSFTAGYSVQEPTAPYDSAGRRLVGEDGQPLKKGPDKTRWKPIEENRAGERKRYRQLSTALMACAEHYLNTTGCLNLQTNTEETVAHAEAAGLSCLPEREKKEKVEKIVANSDTKSDNRPEEVTVTVSNRSTIMSEEKTVAKLTVKLSELQALFVALGFKMASAWLADDNRWPKKLSQLPTVMAETDGNIRKAADALALDSAEKKLLDELLAGMQGEAEIEIEGDTAPKGKGGKKKAGNKDSNGTAAAPKGKGSKKADKPAAGPGNTSEVSIIDLITAKLISPPVNLFKTYKGTDLKAKILSDGKVRFGKEDFVSPSKAVTVARGTVIGGEPNTNGWDFWKLTVDGAKTETLGDVRARYEAKKK